jgi:hypothetical protein
MTDFLDFIKKEETELDENTGLLKIKTTDKISIGTRDNHLKRHSNDWWDVLPTTKRSKKLTEDVNITSLPPGLIIRILNFVPTNDLLNCVSRVSKLFASLINDPEIRLSIKIGRGKKTE